MTNETNIGELIARRRQDLGLSIEELAARMFADDPHPAKMTISLAEKNRAQVPLQWCQKLASALEVDPEWLTMQMLTDRFPEAAAVIQAALDRHQPSS